MKVTTFAIQKGGTGKTSVSVSVAVQLAESRKRVLLIDADPQGNATKWLGIENIKYELGDLLMKKCEYQDCKIQSNVKNLYVLPTSSKLSVLKTYSKTLANESPFAIRHLIKKITDVDYVIIDTSPSFGALEESCLLASDEAITVLQLKEFSLEGLMSFYENINYMKERYDAEKPALSKIVLNARDLRVVQQTDIYEALQKNTNSQIFTIPVDQAFDKAQSVHYPVQGINTVKPATINAIKEITAAIMEE